MNITIAGSSGFVGTELTKYLESKGHKVNKLKRKDIPTDVFDWNPEKNYINQEVISLSDCIINLCGENIASSIWTKNKKECIHKSRINSTKTIVNAINKNSNKKITLINASAIGIYKHNTSGELTENSETGTSFLAKVCKDWEKEVSAINNSLARVCILRFSMILDPTEGALKKMIPAFRLGLGSIMGDGGQFMSWISIVDTVRAIEFCLENEKIHGALNISSPNPISNSEFSKTLAKHFNKSVYFKIPKFILSLIPGKMGEELFLYSYRAIPKALIDAGFNFKHKRLEEYLAANLFKHKF